MSWPALPAEAWLAVAGICAMTVLTSLRLVAGRLDYEIQLHKLRVESRRLRAEYARRLVVTAEPAQAAGQKPRTAQAATSRAAA